VYIIQKENNSRKKTVKIAIKTYYNLKKKIILVLKTDFRRLFLGRLSNIVEVGGQRLRLDFDSKIIQTIFDFKSRKSLTTRDVNFILYTLFFIK